MTSRRSSPPATPGFTAPSAASLAALSALGVAAALWALFLWTELARVRAGGSAVCPLGGGDECAAVWDAPLAVAVHRLSGVPVAGWGLAWGLVALALPLLALVGSAGGRPRPALISAIRLTAAAGVVTVFVLLAVSATSGAFCTGCAVSYLVVAGYAGIALFGWPRVGLPDVGRGAAGAASATALALLALLYPGLQTPRQPTDAGRAAVAAGAAGEGDLAGFVASLTPQLRQSLADALHIYRQGPAFELPPPRALLGASDAPLRITEFTDVRCDHCAHLHETLATLRRHLPADSFSVESRQFPLDGACNAGVQRRDDDPVRCLGARLRICLETHPKAFEFDGDVFRQQRSLSRETLLALASAYAPREQLEACVANPETARKLEEDVALAGRYAPEGTPLVLLNGRKAVSLPQFLYAMVLTRGSPDHPAFAGLPPPNPRAHLH
jgi:serine/threonine-protein kinase